MADLATKFCGVRFKNPVVVGSSELTLSGANMRACVDAGAGGLVAKTLTDSVAMREQTATSKWRYLLNSNCLSGITLRSAILISLSGNFMIYSRVFSAVSFRELIFAMSHSLIRNFNISI